MYKFVESIRAYRDAILRSDDLRKGVVGLADMCEELAIEFHQLRGNISKLSPAAKKMHEYLCLKPKDEVPKYDIIEKELGMARKTISRAIAEVESTLGIKLNRRRRHVETKRKPSRKLKRPLCK